MYSGFQSNSFQTGFQIVRSGGVAPVIDTHDGYTPEDLRRYKKYLRDLQEFREKGLKLPKKKRKKKRSKSEDETRFDPARFTTVPTLDAEIAIVERLIAARMDFLKRQEDEFYQMAVMLLL